MSESKSGRGEKEWRETERAHVCVCVCVCEREREREPVITYWLALQPCIWQHQKHLRLCLLQPHDSWSVSQTSVKEQSETHPPGPSIPPFPSLLECRDISKCIYCTCTATPQLLHRGVCVSTATQYYSTYTLVCIVHLHVHVSACMSCPVHSVSGKHHTMANDAHENSGIVHDVYIEHYSTRQDSDKSYRRANLKGR